MLRDQTAFYLPYKLWLVQWNIVPDESFLSKRCGTSIRGAFPGNSIMSIDLSELLKLPSAEKLRIVEALWDDIGASDEPLVLPPWQREEAHRRSNELKADLKIGIDRAELWRRVDG